MSKRSVNPWQWQDALGFSQAWRVDGPASLVVVSGQVAISADGELVGVDDFDAQAHQVFENLQTVLERAGSTVESIVKLTVFLTDMRRLRDYMRVKSEYLRGDQPASTAIGVTALARPELMIEVEALAVAAT